MTKGILKEQFCSGGLNSFPLHLNGITSLHLSHDCVIGEYFDTFAMTPGSINGENRLLVTDKPV